MTCIEITAFGAPEVLKPARRPTPEPGPGEVLIAVEAAGVNRPDVLQRKGHYPPPPGVSDLPGMEVAGTIVQLGAGVGDWAVGDRVCALIAGGGYAQYATAPAVQCLPIPAGLTAAEAASLPETVFTVWTNVFDRGRFTPGDTVLIHGGTSGIGVMAIQMVTAMAGRAIATAGSDDKAYACEALGAVRGVNYRTEDFVDLTLAATGGLGADIVLDMVGGDYTVRNMAAAAVEGRIVNIAFLRGNKPPIDIALMMQKRLTLTGSTLRGRTAAYKGVIAQALKRRIWPLLESGAVKPVIHAVLPLAEAAQAHALMESSEHIGKIVLMVG
jgi:NADPH2:quinone reductase